MDKQHSGLIHALNTAFKDSRRNQQPDRVYVDKIRHNVDKISYINEYKS